MEKTAPRPAGRQVEGGSMMQLQKKTHVGPLKYNAEGESRGRSIHALPWELDQLLGAAKVPSTLEQMIQGEKKQRSPFMLKKSQKKRKVKNEKKKGKAHARRCAVRRGFDGVKEAAAATQLGLRPNCLIILGGEEAQDRGEKEDLFAGLFPVLGDSKEKRLTGLNRKGCHRGMGMQATPFASMDKTPSQRDAAGTSSSARSKRGGNAAVA